jgi:hypothetical protein
MSQEDDDIRNSVIQTYGDKMIEEADTEPQSPHNLLASAGDGGDPADDTRALVAKRDAAREAALRAQAGLPSVEEEQELADETAAERAAAREAKKPSQADETLSALTRFKELEERLAQREREAAERYSSFDSKVEEAVAARIAALREKADLDPAEYLKSLGIKQPGSIANRLYADQLGDDAPEALKQEVREQKLTRAFQAQQSAMARELQELKESIKKDREQAEQDRYLGTLDSSVGGLDVTKTPYFARLAKKNADAAKQMIRNAAAAHQHLKGSKADAATAAANVEEYLKNLADALKDDGTDSAGALSAKKVQGSAKPRTRQIDSADRDHDADEKGFRAAALKAYYAPAVMNGHNPR